MSRHPSVEATVRFFEHEYLPEPLKLVAHKCSVLKDDMLDLIEDDPEFTVGLRKLLEAKDCFVRATVAQVNRSKGLHPANEGQPL